jgi:hypothetical protein
MHHEMLKGQTSRPWNYYPNPSATMATMKGVDTKIYHLFSLKRASHHVHGTTNRTWSNSLLYKQPRPLSHYI